MGSEAEKNPRPGVPDEVSCDTAPAEHTTTDQNFTPDPVLPEQDQESRATVDEGPDDRTHSSIFNGLDAAARSFLGPAERIDGSLPVVHRHDAEEDASEESLRHIEVHTDSRGHHYAQRITPDPPRT